YVGTGVAWTTAASAAGAAAAATARTAHIAMASRRARRGVLFPNMWMTPRLTGTPDRRVRGPPEADKRGVSLPDEVAQKLRLLGVVGDTEVGAAHHRPGPDPALVEPGGDERR